MDLANSAKEYKVPETKNIADLQSVNINIDVQEYVGEDFSYNYIEVDGERYRVPNIVLKQLKAQLEAKPTLQTFRVVKEGTGINTSYTVIALD